MSQFYYKLGFCDELGNDDHFALCALSCAEVRQIEQYLQQDPTEEITITETLKGNVRFVELLNDEQYTQLNERFGFPYSSTGINMIQNLLGDPAIYNPEDINSVTNCTFGELYQKTNQRKRIIHYYSRL